MHILRKFISVLFLAGMLLTTISCNKEGSKENSDNADNQSVKNESNNNTESKKVAPEGFQRLEVGGVYALAVADYMSPREDLNDVASLQYANAEKELYLVVIEENKDFEAEENYDLQRYYSYVAQNLSANELDNKKVTAPKELKINGNSAIQWEITGLFGEIGVFYVVTVIETDKYFYQILLWTMESNRQELYADMQKMVSSFEEVI